MYADLILHNSKQARSELIDSAVPPGSFGVKRLMFDSEDDKESKYSITLCVFDRPLHFNERRWREWSKWRHILNQQSPAQRATEQTKASHDQWGLCLWYTDRFWCIEVALHAVVIHNEAQSVGRDRAGECQGPGVHNWYQLKKGTAQSGLPFTTLYGHRWDIKQSSACIIRKAYRTTKLPVEHQYRINIKFW